MTLIRFSQIKDGEKLVKSVTDLKSNQIKYEVLDLSTLQSYTDSFGEEIVELNPYLFNDIKIGPVLTELTINGVKYYEDEEYTIDRQYNTLYWDKYKTFTVPSDSKIILTYCEGDVVGPEDPKLLFTYKVVNDSTITIIDYIGSKTKVVIPDTIEGLPVTYIDKYAFFQNHLSSVVIPNSVNGINNHAFANNLLSSVVIPEGVTFLGSGVFGNNKIPHAAIPKGIKDIQSDLFYKNYLISVDIPEGVTHIRSQAFLENRLTSVTLPSTLTEIGYRAFANNPDLKTVNVVGQTAYDYVVANKGTIFTSDPTINLVLTSLIS